MKKQKMGQLFGLAGAAALTISLAACAGGQSTADACNIYKDKVMEVASSADSEATSAAQQALQGEDVDFAAIFKPANDAFAEAQDEITNEDVAGPLKEFADSFQAYAKSAEGISLPDASSIDMTDQAAVDEYNTQVKAAQEKSQEIIDASKDLQDKQKALVEVCNAG